MSDGSNNGSKSAAVRKRCFVTIGATAPFNSLIRTVLGISFLKSLHDAGYTELRIQYGKEGVKVYEDQYWVNKLDNRETRYGIDITGFDFNTSGLKSEMLSARGDAVDGLMQGTSGVVVSHAGSGSILDALRVGVPLLVVPNTDLMDNHQAELAEVLEKERYVIHGKLGNLAADIPRVEQLRVQQQTWPPPTSRDSSGRLSKVIKEEMGWLD